MNTQRRKAWMWAEACALLDEAERRQRRFFELVTVPSTPPAWEPPANIFTNDSELFVVVALPGARAADVSVQLTSSGLLVETMVPPPTFPAGVKVVRLEIPYGRMRRRIDLPAGRYALRENYLDNGYLHVRLERSTL